jgi:ABC-type arginine transport system ATPase subunit
MTDLEAIADRYYCHLLEGQQEHVAYHAALDLYLERHL